MFEAGGFGVALTVALVGGGAPDDSVPARSGVTRSGVTRRATRLSEVLPPERFDDAHIARELAAVTMGEAKLAATSEAR